MLHMDPMLPPTLAQCLLHDISRMHSSLLITLPLVLLLTLPALVQGQSVCPHRPIELQFHAAQRYAHPVRDVELFCTFTSPTGSATTVRGFWNGDSTYLVRFAPDRQGVWTWRTRATAIGDAGLNDRAGVFDVGAPCSDAPFDQHGLPRVARNHRSLAHADGTPWFYLSDTAWELAWKATMEEFRTYLSDRRSKGFNAVQFCAISHQLNGPRGMSNQYQQETFLDSTLTRPNPRYFEFLDAVVTMLNDSGMVAVISPLWAWVASVHRDDPRYDARFFSEDEAAAWARYVGARYAGHNVMWIVGGDKGCDTDEQRRYWSRFAHELREADGGSHLTTLHPNGGSASYTYFDSTATWLDLHMYQSSHTLFNISWWDLALKGWERTPAKPLLDGEAVYEDLFDNFWLHDETSDTTGFRWFTADDLTRPRYESVLSGALAGISYGASGVYQWHVERLPEPSKHPRKYVLDAIRFPGSARMQAIRTIMTALDWSTFQPAPTTWQRQPGMEQIATSINERYVVSFFPRAVAPSIYRYTGPLVTYYTWVDPHTGRRPWSPAGYAVFPHDGAVEKPDTNEWLFVGSLNSSDLMQLPIAESSTQVEVLRDRIVCSLHPHPVDDGLTLSLQVPPQALPVEIRVLDLLGREIRRDAVHVTPAGHAYLRMETGTLPPGSYLLMLRTASLQRALRFVVHR